MEPIARFEKVSQARFLADWQKTFPTASEAEARQVYEHLQLPSRATAGSAGYDFHAPLTFTLQPGEQILIPTGIRVLMRSDYVLMLFPRSGLGFRYRLQLNNTVGVIDSDYSQADNEGHIFCKLTNDSRDGKSVTVEAGSGLIQGIFVPYGRAENDQADGVRHGGFGSTDQKG